MADDTRTPMIVTFKPKDQRPEGEKDKLEIVSNIVSSKVTFFTADDMSREVAVPSGMPTEEIGYDVNSFEAPLVPVP